MPKLLIHLFTTFISIFFLLSLLAAQETDHNFFSIIDDIAEHTDDNDELQNIIDNLNDLINNPINLNLATEADLQKILFLNDFQVKSILNYREEYGNFLSLNELLLVPGIRLELFEKIKYFVTIAEIKSGSNNNNSPGRVKSDLIVRYKTRFGTPVGFTDKIDSTRRFMGKNRYLMSRYEITAGKNVRAGFIAEQDPGEPLFSEHNKYSPDHLSGFVEFNSQKKPIRLLLGDYKAGFGQGLVRGNSFIGRSSNGVILPERDKLTRSLSTSESGHLRGLALQTQTGNLLISSFVSLVNLDATIRNTIRDETDLRYFSSINRTGLHRNISEVRNRNTLKQLNAGMNLSFRFKNLTIGLYSEKVNFNLPMEISEYKPGIDPPKYKTGFYNGSFHFRASIQKTMIFGEWATDEKGSVAILNGLTSQLHPLASLSILHRKYSSTYMSFYASGFGKSSGVKNEEGFYIGIDMHPLSFLSLSCYADHYAFPYMRTNMPAPSSGNDYMANAKLSIGRDYQFNIRYKVSHQKVKTPRIERGIDLNNKSSLESWRFVSRLDINESILTETRYEQTKNHEYPDLKGKGNYLGQKLILRYREYKTNIYLSYGIFDVPEWKNRIYIYEHDLLYDFSIPAMYRKGSRFSLMLKTRLYARCDIWIKYYITQYPNKIERGTGADRIISDRDSGVKVQVRIKLDNGSFSFP